EPFLFSGSLKENIVYANERYKDISDEALETLLKDKELHNLLSKFEAGLSTQIVTSSETMSLGQKQLIAFMRAFLREPELLILDEATANIDTVTEQLLEEILQKLPKYTTKVIIAHRLNTIKTADEIFFVNAGVITLACSMEEAMDLLLNGTKKS
ncbi:MAG TPA: ATP-binding cassette domain-containing protein, partial [Ignavibacteriaceae bacterium]